MSDPSDLTSEHWKGIKPVSKHWYNVIDKLDSGDYTETYLVAQSVTEADKESISQGGGKTFALKILTGEQDEDVETFKNERAFLLTNDHPSILDCNDMGEWNGHPFYVSEYHPDSLKDLIEIRSNPTNGKKVTLATQLVSALVELEKSGVVHRDVKPDNILVIGHQCVLGDFGLMLFEEESVENKYRFSKNYPAPEFADDQAVGEITSKANVFQLGLVIAKLFTGENPANRTDKNGDQIEYNERDDLGKIRCNTSDEVEDLLNRMLTKNVEDRPSATDIIGEWGEIQEKETENSLI